MLPTVREIRIRDWWYFLPLPLLYCAPEAGLAGATAALRGVLLAAVCLGLAYYVNNQADRSGDLDPAKNPLVARPPGVERWVAVCLSLSAAAVGAAFVADRIVGAAVLIAILAGWTYSYFGRLKRLPFLGTVTNVFIFAPLLIFGRTEGAAAPEFATGVVVIFVLLLLQNQLIHEAAHSEEDQRSGVRSSYMVLGKPVVTVVVAALGVAQVGVVFLGAANLVDVVPLLPFLLLATLVPIRMGSAVSTAELVAVRRLQRLLGLVGGGAFYLRHAVG